MISYAITASTEHEELQRLLRYLTKHWADDDEIIIQLDADTATDEVFKVADDYKILIDSTYQDRERIQVVTYHLNKDFAAFKNNLRQYCHNPWIFNIDADELPSSVLLDNIHAILEENVDVDVILVPRWNTVDGITEEHIQRWGWNVDTMNRVNYPDYQWRIYKNTESIKWMHPVHEVLIGYRTISNLPYDNDTFLGLFHNKTIERQERQNEFYTTIK